MHRLPLLVLCVALVAGCGGADKPATPPPRAPETLKPPTAKLDPTKNWALTFVTDHGTFVVSLEPRVSPHATASLVALARRGFFDTTIFHRIVPGYIIQGGDPTRTGRGGPGYTTVDPPRPETRYTKGIVAMGKTDTEAPGTAGSQFFVMTADAPLLSPDYAVVGRVTRGMDVVEKIGQLGDLNDPNGTPTETVVVEHVTVASR
jgi:peptidyl-prolyl cis-trans isomerase B (cyclophilin B)